MVLFDYDKLLKLKYINYSKTNLAPIDFESYKEIGLDKIKKIFHNYFTNLNQKYIENLFKYKKTKMLFLCSDTTFNINNIKSILIYSQTKSNDLIKYYLLALGTHYKYRNFGYGKISLNEFINLIKQTKTNLTKKILLKSVESSLNFYYAIGFVNANLKSNKLFFKFEPADDLRTNSNKLLEYLIV